MMTPTTTTNRLHFEDLEPRRFEEFGFQLLHRLFKWKRLDHTGVCGNDGGVDIYGVTTDNVPCYCQVKRYQKLTQSDITNIYETIIRNNRISATENPQFILICACDLSKGVLDKIYEDGEKFGFSEIHIYSRTKLESLLYNGHQSLLKSFFGTPRIKQPSNSALIRKQLAAKKRIVKALERKDLAKIPYETLAANPSMRFITDEFMLLSALSSLSSDRYGEDVSFGKAYPQNFRDEGLELLLPLFDNIYFNVRNNTWRKSNGKDDTPQKDEYELLCQLMVLLPYSQIVDIELDGDQYVEVPVLHCQENLLFDSFSKVTLRHYYLNIIFDENIELTQYEVDLINEFINTNIRHKKQLK